MTDQALADHLTSYLGQGSRETEVGGVEIWRHERPEYVSFATHGLSDQSITAVLCVIGLAVHADRGRLGRERERGWRVPWRRVEGVPPNGLPVRETTLADIVGG